MYLVLAMIRVLNVLRRGIPSRPSRVERDVGVARSFFSRSLEPLEQVSPLRCNEWQTGGRNGNISFCKGKDNERNIPI